MALPSVIALSTPGEKRKDRQLGLLSIIHLPNGTIGSNVIFRENAREKKKSNQFQFASQSTSASLCDVMSS